MGVHVKGDDDKSAKDPKKEKKTGPSFWNRMWSGFKSWFGWENSAGIATATAGVIKRKGVVEIGSVVFEGIAPTFNFDAVLAGFTRFGLWSLPLTLKGDTPEKEPTINLYRGVSSTAKGTMYLEAIQGIAIPNGFRTVSTIKGPHCSQDLHAEGDNYSIWTSWTTDLKVAEHFSGGKGGVVMSKKINLGQVMPNLSMTAQGNSTPSGRPENEWLVPGVVYGASVYIIK